MYGSKHITYLALVSKLSLNVDLDTILNNTNLVDDVYSLCVVEIVKLSI